MGKKIRLLLLMLLMIVFIPIKVYAADAYTTDDLREMMGMHRLTEDDSMAEIKGILSTCYKQKEWNELVLALGDIEEVQLKEFKETEDTWYQAKDILEEDFSSNKSIEIILNDYVEYETAASLRTEYTETNSFELSLINNADIDAKIAYANSLLSAVNDYTNIGEIGSNMKSFTKDKLMVYIPFGDSFSIESGKKQNNDGLTVSIQQDHKIYSQFNGKVTAVTADSVTVRTGSSLEIEYTGIKPLVETKQKIKQYNTLGKTKTKTMTIRFKLNTVYFDPLLLYGTRSTAWYEQWQNANPGCTIDKNDYSRLLDKLSENASAKASDLNQAGAMTDKNGTAAPIIIQGDNKYTDTPDNIITETTEPGIIVNGE
jgi:hypothetical protein